MVICKNCSTDFNTKYCPNCGVPARAHRIDRKYVLHEIQHTILHFERGFLYTVKELLIRPGISIRKFVQGDRARHYKPIGFVVVTSVIYIFVAHFLHFDEYAAANLDEKKTFSTNLEKLFRWVSDHYNYSNLIEIVFIAFTLKLFFRKRGYNYFEYLVLLCYLTGIGMLILLVAMIFSQIFHFRPLFNYSVIIVILYSVWAIGKFISDGKLKTYLKALLAYLAGVFLFYIAVIVTAIVLDVLKVQL